MPLPSDISPLCSVVQVSVQDWLHTGMVCFKETPSAFDRILLEAEATAAKADRTLLQAEAAAAAAAVAAAKIMLGAGNSSNNGSSGVEVGGGGGGGEGEDSGGDGGEGPAAWFVIPPYKTVATTAAFISVLVHSILYHSHVGD